MLVVALSVNIFNLNAFSTKLRLTFRFFVTEDCVYCLRDMRLFLINMESVGFDLKNNISRVRRWSME